MVAVLGRVRGEDRKGLLSRDSCVVGALGGLDVS